VRGATSRARREAERRLRLARDKMPS